MSILDFYWRLSLDGAYEWAKWRDKKIKVKVISPDTLKRGAFNNLLADEGYMALQTRFVEDYKIDDDIQLRGKTYKIVEIARDICDGGHGAMFADGCKQDITLQLFEVGYGTRTLRCATPKISVDGTTATIVCDTSEASVYFTVDGTLPSSLSPKYSQPFDIGTADTVYAIALKDGRMPSKIGVWKR